jgi:hypothetical protein
MLNPHPRRRARCTSAEPSSRFSGRPTKLFPPASASSQKPSCWYDGEPTGALDAPERLTPRRRSVRPWASTNAQEVVCTKSADVEAPVVGDVAGTEGIVVDNDQAGSRGARRCEQWWGHAGSGSHCSLSSDHDAHRRPALASRYSYELPCPASRQKIWTMVLEQLARLSEYDNWRYDPLDWRESPDRGRLPSSLLTVCREWQVRSPVIRSVAVK